MRCGNNRPGTVTEQHRQTIRRHHHADDSDIARKCAVGYPELGGRTSVKNRRAMHLLQPAGFCRQTPAKSLTVGRYRRRIIAHVIAEVEASVWGHAYPAMASSDETAHSRRRWPVGNKPGFKIQGSSTVEGWPRMIGSLLLIEPLIVIDVDDFRAAFRIFIPSVIIVCCFAAAY